jgi:hypothetical protein
MNGVKIALIISLILIFALGITLFSACKKEEKKEQKTGETTTTETTEPTKTEPTKFKVDLTKTVGDYQVMVKTWELFAGDESLKPKEGNVIVKIDLTVSHAKKQPFMVSSSMSFRLKGKDTKEFEPIKYEGKDKFTDGMIEAGKSALGIVAFELPKDTADLVFSAGKFKYDDPTKVTFPLTKDEPVVEPPA